MDELSSTGQNEMSWIFFFNIFREKTDRPKPIPRDLSIGPPDRFASGKNEVLRGIKGQESNTEIY